MNYKIGDKFKHKTKKNTYLKIIELGSSLARGLIYSNYNGQTSTLCFKKTWLSDNYIKIDKFPWEITFNNVKEFPKIDLDECTCGAKHTSNPNFHLNYCVLNKR
jgi:hypothetical protein